MQFCCVFLNPCDVLQNVQGKNSQGFQITFSLLNFIYIMLTSQCVCVCVCVCACVRETDRQTNTETQIPSPSITGESFLHSYFQKIELTVYSSLSRERFAENQQLFYSSLSSIQLFRYLLITSCLPRHCAMCCVGYSGEYNRFGSSFYVVYSLIFNRQKTSSE